MIDDLIAWTLTPVGGCYDCMKIDASIILVLKDYMHACPIYIAG